LVVSPGKNLWHCLGACQAGGSVIDWVIRAEGVSCRHAVELLRSDRPTSGRAGRPPARTTKNLLPTALSADASVMDLRDRVGGYYHDTLPDADEEPG
jgi:DNA primase